LEPPLERKTPAKTVIFGTGSYAEVAHFYLTQDSPHEVVAFAATADSIRETSFGGLPVVPFEELASSHPPSEHSLLVAVGYRKVNRIRTDFFLQAKAKGYPFVRYVNSKATTWKDLSVGDNTFVFENNVIQPFVTVGDNCVLWSGNHIGHHTKIADHCFITSHVVVSGNCRVGENCFIGVNATIGDGVTVAPRCVIGAGAVILKDTVEAGVYKVKSTEASPFKSHELKNF
jgi:sugar O-acyltransferase (sialic acid O-acetyltransferase NeuD family)